MRRHVRHAELVAHGPPAVAEVVGVAPGACQLSALFVCYSYETLFVRYLPSFVLLTDSESVTWGS